MTWIEDLTGVKTVRFDGETVATRAKLNFLGDGVTVADNAGSGQTDVTVLSGGTAVYVTDLTALAGTVDRARVYCDGYAARYDGGGGTFVWHAGDSTTADGGTVLGAGTGRWKRVYTGPTNPKWFGGRGDGNINDAPAINAMVAVGIDTYFSRGAYSITSGLSITTPLSVRGEGPHQSTITPDLSASTDCLAYAPSNSLQPNLCEFSGFGILNRADGSREGRHGIYVDTTTARSVGGLRFSRIQTGAPDSNSRYGFCHENDAVDNVNGGMYASTICDSSWSGGIRLILTGDSNNIQRNICTGRNIGVHASLVPGASCLAIENNNITNDGGAIRLDSGARFRIIGNNTENYNAGALAQNGGAGGVYVSGDVVGVGGSYYVYGGVIRENLFSVYGSSDADCCVRLANCRGTLVQDNVFLSGGVGAGPSVAIKIDSTCADVRIGPNSYNAALRAGGVVTGAPNITDNGVGTMGLKKVPTWANSWATSASHDAYFEKSLSGVVTFTATIAGGTTTGGIQISTLPTGFRPTATVRATAYAAGVGVVEVTVESAGEVRLAQSTAGCSYVSFTMSFHSDLVGSSVSLE